MVPITPTVCSGRALLINGLAIGHLKGTIEGSESAHAQYSVRHLCRFMFQMNALAAVSALATYVTHVVLGEELSPATRTLPPHLRGAPTRHIPLATFALDGPISAFSNVRVSR